MRLRKQQKREKEGEHHLNKGKKKGKMDLFIA